MFIFCLNTKNEPKKIKASTDSFVAYLLDISLTHRDKSSVRVSLKTMLCSSLKQMRLPFCLSLKAYSL